MYEDIKGKILYLKAQFDKITKGVDELMELDLTLPINMERGHDLHELSKAMKAEFNETWEKIEKLRFSKNSVSPVRLEEVEGFDSKLNDDPFLQAVLISEGLFTFYTVLLPSVALRVLVNKEYIPVRALMRLTPKIHLITNKCRKRLNLPLNPLKPIFDPNIDTPTGIVGMTILTICPHYSRTPPITIEAFVTKHPFVDTPVLKVHNSIRKQLLTYVLCDPHFDDPGDIELLINMTQLPNSGNTLQKYHVPGTSCSAFSTVFGWAVTGMAPVEEVGRSFWADGLLGDILKNMRKCDEFFSTHFPSLTD